MPIAKLNETRCNFKEVLYTIAIAPVYHASISIVKRNGQNMT
jgi:hypothetical protein